MAEKPSAGSRPRGAAKTIGDWLTFVNPDLAKASPPSWPPDVFALAGTLLLQSGAYVELLEHWPPTRIGSDAFKLPPEVSEGADEEPELAGWARTIRGVGREWRKRALEGRSPQTVKQWWNLLWGHRATPIPEIRANPELACALGALLTAADEASYGLGFWARLREGNEFRLEGLLKLVGPDRDSSTLCSEHIDGSVVRVLPKAHTPQSGLSIRSFSHHLSLWPGRDVAPAWHPLRTTEWMRGNVGDRHALNLLLVPWPLEVLPTQFEQVVTGGLTAVRAKRLRVATAPELASGYGRFRYHREGNPSATAERFAGLFKAASQLAGGIDGVVFPELALTPEEFDAVSEHTVDQGSFLVAGINDTTEGRNLVGFSIPIHAQGQGGQRTHIRLLQGKHHRWKLDRSQIIQYGLGGQLDPDIQWWEDSKVDQRRVQFVSLLPWLSLCTLVCEDLARQDPVSRLVRAVGPNLVIALLMDGPQLPSRWPARYATVLADDPGSSVLTLTSAGMCMLSRPRAQAPLRTVALWKDPHSGDAIPIDLPDGAEGLVLHLVRGWAEEYTADGRSDGGEAGYPGFGGVHPVFVRRGAGVERG